MHLQNVPKFDVLLHILIVLGGYITGPDPPRLIKEAILQLCGALKTDSVALVDAIAPPDFILNSPIGNSDGQVWEKVFRINPEFMILRLTFCRKSASKC